MRFRQKVSFKSALEIFTSVNGHLRTALKHNLEHFVVFIIHRVALIFVNVCNYNLNPGITVWIYIRTMSFHYDNMNNNLIMLKNNKNQFSGNSFKKVSVFSLYRRLKN